jgi:multiple antibiotic resistance protein
MFGPGAIATVLGMTSKIRQSSSELWSFVAIAAAIVTTMFLTFLCLAYADRLTKKLGANGNRCDHPHCRLLRLGHGSRIDL